MLVRIDNQAMADVVAAMKVPIVNLRGTLPGLALPLVQVDNRQVAQIVAQHFVERGLKHFAFCGRPRGVNPVLDQRCDVFREFTFAVAGVACVTAAALTTPGSARTRRTASSKNSSVAAVL